MKVNKAMKVMYVLKVKVKFRLSFCLCSQWQGLCSTGLAATGGLEAGEEHLLPSAKVIFCHHDDDDDIVDMDGDIYVRGRAHIT